AVRLMTTLNLPGAICPAQAEQVRRYVRALLESRLPDRPNLGDELAVALGRNAESLAEVAPGPRSIRRCRQAPLRVRPQDSAGLAAATRATRARNGELVRPARDEWRRED